MTPRVTLGLCTLAFTAAAVASGLLGLQWLARMSNHQGFMLVPVEDHVAAPIPLPRRTLVVVLDGLGLAAAQQTPMGAWLKQRGRCFPTTQQTPTMSRPVYAVISTGLEQARTGARANGDGSPLRVQSIWEVMRNAGLRVSVWSEVTWWQELFPTGFTTVRSKAQPPEPAWTDERVALVHLIDVDHAGHEHGSDSPEYAAAAALDSTTVIHMLEALDLTQDLALVTADHGHWHSGGHGGDEPLVSQVLTCAVGRGVKPGKGTLPGNAVGPALVALMGLPFPRFMHAGGDGLDAVLDSLDEKVLSAAYLQDRTAAVERFRHAQLDVLKAYGASSWEDINARGSQRHHRDWAAAVAGLVLLLCLWALRFRTWSAFLAALCMLVLTPLVLALWKGTLSVSIVATRPSFVWAVALVSAAVAAPVQLLHWFHRRQTRPVLHAHAMVAFAGLYLHVVHIIIHGWTPGVPLPSPALWLLPLVCAVLVPVHAFGAGISAWVGARLTASGRS